MHGIDVETTALTPEEGRLRLVQLSDGTDTDVHDAFLDDTDAIRETVQEREMLVAHNAVFERLWLKAALGIDRADLHDTMVMSQVYYTGTKATQSKQFSHSLQAAVKRELKREISKEQQMSDWGAAALTREQIEYAALDARRKDVEDGKARPPQEALTTEKTSRSTSSTWAAGASSKSPTTPRTTTILTGAGNSDPSPSGWGRRSEFRKVKGSGAQRRHRKGR
jgi:3'-5' exonuclease